MSRYKIPEEDIQKIIALYQEGKTPLELGKQFGIQNGSVVRILRKRGIARTQHAPVVSEDKIKIIIDEYSQGVSSEIIALKLGINGSTVCRILKRNNITIRPPEQNKRKYKINEDYFEKIDSEEKAYFLGFLYADGNLTKKGHGIKITLNPKDRDVLEKFSMAIYGFVKIFSEINQEGIEYQSVRVYCKKMHQDLIKLGCIPKKTFKIRFLKDLMSKDLLQHFIRGYMDGDGCICLTNKKRPRVDFTSNKGFLEGLSEFFKEEIGVDFGKLGRDRGTDTRSIQAQGFLKSKAVLDYIYKDATIYMKRKEGYYQDFNSLHQEKKDRELAKISDMSKYGTYFTAEFEGNKLTSEFLKGIEDKAKIAEHLYHFYQINGFPYPVLSNDELLKEFILLRNSDSTSILKDNNIIQAINYTGSPISKHFHPHFFEVKNGLQLDKASMLEAFNTPKLLKKVIKNRLDGNFNMTGSMLRQGLSNSKAAIQASIFPPLLAKLIYEKFAQANDIIYDYSAGFGHRLLGALSLPFKVKYVGVDPLPKTIDQNQALFNFFKQNAPGLDKEVELVGSGSESYCDFKYEGKVALAFSSPPYFNLEVYSKDVSQAYTGGYCQFINEYWRKTVQNIGKLLKSDGKFILNIKEELRGFNLAEDMLNVAKEFGFKVIETYQLQLTRNLVFKNKAGKHKYEPIYVMSK